MISIEDLVVEYSDRRALDGVDMRLNAGEIVGLVGPSGSGKSTLLRTLNGFVRPTSGRVIVDGRDPAQLRGATLRRHRAEVGMIYQQFHLVGRLTAAENAAVGACCRVRQWRSLIGSLPAEHRADAYRALERVGLGERTDQRVDTLSGGQQQRVAIARTLVQDPRVVLADEPVASLDPGSSERVLSLLRSLARQDKRTVFVSLHQVDLAGRFCDRIVALGNGRVIMDSAPGEITPATWDELYATAAADREPAVA
ncbi:phosphonate ABC transporter ATP-binding protein [Nocardia cerradoensis]|uniref:phosphonate ABC transporter ATP-binding protein n=1 Tax=Nocardia cerradoensis TaxID=85688 RepID=UPI0002FF5EB7|nr:phosphonate ABC transporter ATP-binding protein [Nocardia cerradoensis]NKY41887.1 phosphonate ABC transporter ATP-binding protein [Nocardia cerradoensis]